MQRVEYMKTDGGCPKSVTYECDEFGQERFAERDCRETDWVPFVPSAEERQVAHTIRDESVKDGGILHLQHVHGILTIEWWR